MSLYITEKACIVIDRYRKASAEIIAVIRQLIPQVKPWMENARFYWHATT